MIFPIGSVKYRLLRHIYEKGNCRISEAIRATNAPQKAAYRYIEELLASRIIEETKEGSKPFLRILRPSFSEAGKSCFVLIEAQKLLDLFSEYPQLKGPLQMFSLDLRGGVGVIFGSFARHAARKDSDLDIAIISERRIGNIETLAERHLVTVPNRYSIRQYRKSEFLAMLKKKDDFVMQMIENHVIFSNTGEWIEFMAEIRL